jgi:hypothetical protein
MDPVGILRARPTGWSGAALTETLTESFCERCGTRYEFTAPTRLNPLRKTRGLIGGLKNYLTSQDALGDALDDAMRTEESALATAQLDAFHEAFNFCIDCRQYTCVSCWNDDAGRCRTCVPVPGTDDLAERLAAATVAVAAAEPVAGIAEPDISADDGQPHPGLEAWPTSDLPDDAVATNGDVPLDEWATTPGAWTNAPPAPTYQPEEPVATIGGFVGADGFVYETKDQADQVAATMLAEALAAEEAARVAAELEATQAAEGVAAAAAQAVDDGHGVAAEADAPQPEATWVSAQLDDEPATAETPSEPLEAVEPEPEPDPVALESAPEPPRLRVVAWDEDTTLELEPEPIVAEAELEPEPILAEVEPEPVVAEAEIEPEPVVAEADVEPEPVTAEAEPEPVPPTPIAAISETILHFPTRPVQPDVGHPAAAADESPEAVARRAQLDLLGLDGQAQPDMPAVLPYRSRGAAVSSAELAIRAAAGQRFWEASAREVAGAVGNVGVQNCGECGLSLSANARFCRRCGTRQAQPA